MAALILPDNLEYRPKFNDLTNRFFKLFFSYFIN
jgi:hypothetical protein